ncbi:hypothetical protein [Cryptosporangium phraense]|uniref:Tetratricopeptide repeat protein n=1 Tax=Cryptosporangium phraense TaxID=2593070 RepID=A0A545AEW8_9ACTN|nr:hypothetical protein [Cryptosporangium phraense]TQS39871.1 hypothetical protein FL583_37640 [Cryptosporangium phraense]
MVGATGRTRPVGPDIPADIEVRDLDRDVRAELRALPKGAADTVARHLVAAGRFLDSDPDRALQHAQAARAQAGRIASVREAVGLAAYHAGEWKLAIGELRAYRRLTGSDVHMAVIADSERALGRPEKAIELAASPEAAQLDTETRVELLIVAAGARQDAGDLDGALATLDVPELRGNRPSSWLARLRYAYAELLLAAGRPDEAREWFVQSADADTDGDTDADERVLDLDGFLFTDDPDDDAPDAATNDDADEAPEAAAADLDDYADDDLDEDADDLADDDLADHAEIAATPLTETPAPAESAAAESAAAQAEAEAADTAAAKPAHAAAADAATASAADDPTVAPATGDAATPLAGDIAATSTAGATATSTADAADAVTAGAPDASTAGNDAATPKPAETLAAQPTGNDEPRSTAAHATDDTPRSSNLPTANRTPAAATDPAATEPASAAAADSAAGPSAGAPALDDSTPQAATTDPTARDDDWDDDEDIAELPTDEQLAVDEATPDAVFSDRTPRTNPEPPTTPTPHFAAPTFAAPDFSAPDLGAPDFTPPDFSAATPQPHDNPSDAPHDAPHDAPRDGSGEHPSNTDNPSPPNG